MSHDAKIEAAVRRRWPDGQIEPWRRPVEVFRLIELELKAWVARRRREAC